MISTLFPTGRCPSCEHEVMLYNDLSDDGELVQRCLHCDAIPTPRQGNQTTVRMVGAPAVRKLGYLFEGDDPTPPPAEGCGKPNCGNGTCKNSGKPHPFSSNAG